MASSVHGHAEMLLKAGAVEEEAEEEEEEFILQTCIQKFQLKKSRNGRLPGRPYGHPGWRP